MHMKRTLCVFMGVLVIAISLMTLFGGRDITDSNFGNAYNFSALRYVEPQLLAIAFHKITRLSEHKSVHTPVFDFFEFYIAVAAVYACFFAQNIANFSGQLAVIVL